jgi:hypothetical protein
MPDLLQLAVFAREFSDIVRFTWPPPVVQRILFGLIAPFAGLLGYRGSYREYLTRRQESCVPSKRPTLSGPGRALASSWLETA